MNRERLIDKVRRQMGATPDERLNCARARTTAVNKRLAQQNTSQTVTNDLLAKTCSL